MLKFHKAVSGVFIAIFIVLLLAISLTDSIDRSPIEHQEFYSNTLSKLHSLTPTISEGNTWLVGWSKVNATPKQAASLVGYAPRGKYEFVQDSSYIRSLIVGNGEQNIAFLNYELLIIHPYLATSIREAVNQSKLPVDNLYFTATHTHSGIGGYIPGLMGKVAFGGFDQAIVDFLTEQTLKGLQMALADQDTAFINFQVAETDTLVYNRFVREDPVDPFVRQLIFQKKDGRRGTFLSYSAHPTTLARNFMGLSGDYPHYLMQNLEGQIYDFALFAAGTVGSHGPNRPGNQPEDTQAYANALYQQSLKHVKRLTLVNSNRLSFTLFPIELRKPQYRLGKNIKLKPALFNFAFGEINPHFDVVLIGNTLLISSSGEISGVWMAGWEVLAKRHGLNLMVTTFNGSYIGYITPDEYYDYDYHEVSAMNWFGPGNGAYFDTIIQGLIVKNRQY
jgi:hypothetical protein